MIEMREGKCVYAIEAGGFHKIGRAKSITKRLIGIRSSCPLECSLAWVLYNDKNGIIEKKLHRWLAQHRVRGEWFLLPEPHLQTLLAINATYFAPGEPNPFGLAAGLVTDDPASPASTFPRRLREARRRRRWAMKTVAKRSGYSEAFISLLERGLRRPSTEVLATLAHLYGGSNLTAADLLLSPWPD